MDGVWYGLRSLLWAEAVVFTTMTWTQKSQLYFSIFMSFVSIGYAFSTIDMLKNGRMLVKIPGFCKNFDGRFFTVFFFRVAEITSRATSLALFQAITRPYGMFVLITADALIMASLTVLFQSQVGKYTPIGRLAFVRRGLCCKTPVGIRCFPCAFLLLCSTLQHVGPPFFFRS